MMTVLFVQVQKYFKYIFYQLWLSLSSIKFYQQLISSYKGYGLKYILNISFASSLLCSLYMLNSVDNIRHYFRYGTILSPGVINLNHILSQIPEFKYDGKKISLDYYSEPIYINNIYNQPVIAIDLYRKLSIPSKNRVPFFLTSEKLIFNINNQRENSITNLNVDYQQIFGTKKKIITQQTVRLLLEKIFSIAPKVIIYVIFPLIGVAIFLNTLFEKSLITLMIYSFAKFMSINLPIKVFIRLTLFASGIFVLLHPITLFIFPFYSNLMWIIQIWTNSLMVIAILRFANYKIL